MFVIYVSGIDGCGKTTQAKRLAAWLEGRGLKGEYQWLRWEPSVVSLIRFARRILVPRRPVRSSANSAIPELASKENDSHDRWTQIKQKFLRIPFLRGIWLFFAMRDYFRAYRRSTRRWRADYVVLDRYLYDFVVDQSLNLGISVGDFFKITDSSILRLMRKPNLSVFIDVSPETAWIRKGDGTSLNYLQRRAGPYQQIPASSTVLHVDGMKDVDAVHHEISKWVAERIGEARP